MRKLGLVFRFYRQSMMFLSLLLTSIFTYIGIVNNHYDSFSAPAVVFARQFVFVVVVYFIYDYKSQELIYYRNLGLSKGAILIIPTLVDCLISIILIYSIIG